MILDYPVKILNSEKIKRSLITLTGYYWNENAFLKEGTLMAGGGFNSGEMIDLGSKLNQELKNDNLEIDLINSGKKFIEYKNQLFEEYSWFNESGDIQHKTIIEVQSIFDLTVKYRLINANGLELGSFNQPYVVGLSLEPDYSRPIRLDARLDSTYVSSIKIGSRKNFFKFYEEQTGEKFDQENYDYRNLI